MKPDPAASCRFFTAEDACRFALAAYYAASRDIEPPAGEPWWQEGEPWSTGADFAEAFCAQVAERVAALAYSLHLPRSGSATDGVWWPNPGESLTDTGAAHLRRIMNHLPPPDNAPHNAPARGSDNA